MLTHHHAVPLSIALRHYCQVLLRPLLRCLESKSDQSLYAMPCEDRHFCARLPRKTSMRTAALASVLT